MTIKDDNPVERVFEAFGRGDLYRQQQLDLIEGKTLVYMTEEEKRFLLSLLKREINHNNLHLNSKRGRYRQTDHLAYQNELAMSLRRALLLSPDAASAYRRRKGL